MANELKVGGSMRFFDGTVHVQHGKQGLVLDVAGSQYIKNMQSVGATEELLVVGDVALGGYFCAVNTHATATVSYRAATSLQDTVDIGPGEVALFRTHVGSTPYLISSVAGAELEYILLEA